MKSIKVPEHLYKKALSDLISNKPALADTYSYKQERNALGEKVCYYYWSNEIKISDNEYKELFESYNYFYVPLGIKYTSSKDIINDSRRIQLTTCAVARKGVLKNHEFSIAKDTGFIIPEYHFLSNQMRSLNQVKIAYEKTLDSFRLKSCSIFPVTKVSILAAYRLTLLEQLERQALIVKELNEEIASILKVFIHRLYVLSGRTERKFYIISNDTLSSLFSEILGGSSRNMIDIEGSIKNYKPKQFKDEIYNTTVNGLNYLLEKKDPVLEISCKIFDLLHPIEMILEQALINNRLITPKEYTALRMPDPFQIANKKYKSTKKKKYLPETIGQAMQIVKDYIVDNEITDLYNRVNSLQKSISEIDFKDPSGKPTHNTIVNWIKIYATAAGVKTKH